MTEKPKDNVRQMFREIPDIETITDALGRVVGVAGFKRGQEVNIMQGDTVDSGWRISNFDMVGDETMVAIRKGDGEDAQRETIPLKKLREMNPV